MKTTFSLLPVTSQITPHGVQLTNEEYDFILTHKQKCRKRHAKMDWGKVTQLFNTQFSKSYSVEMVKQTQNQFSKKNVQIWNNQQKEYVGIQKNQNSSSKNVEYTFHLQSIESLKLLSKELQEKNPKIQLIAENTICEEDGSKHIDSFNENCTFVDLEENPFSLVDIETNPNEDISKYLN